MHIRLVSFSMRVMKGRSFVYISLLADAAIAVFKFIAACFTVSASMMSEGVHSVADAMTQVLLIWGIKKSKQKPDEIRPFGYGRELYFWSFIVSLTMFLLGGCISIYRGLVRFRNTSVEDGVIWNYSVLLVAFLFTCVSMTSALNAFNKQRGDKSFWRAILSSKDPSVFIVLLGDIGDIAGLVIAFAGSLVAHLLNNPFYDALASIIIGCIMIGISAILVRESKSLLIGEPIGLRTVRQIIRLAESDEGIIRIKRHFSTYMGPEEIVLQLNAVFKKNLTTPEITESINRVIKNIQANFPSVTQIFIEPVRM